MKKPAAHNPTVLIRRHLCLLCNLWINSSLHRGATMSDPHESGTWRKGAGPAAPADIKLLQGPRPRGLELGSALRIFFEIVRGFRKLHFVGPCVTVFGSA